MTDSATPSILDRVRAAKAAGTITDATSTPVPPTAPAAAVSKVDPAAVFWVNLPGTADVVKKTTAEIQALVDGPNGTKLLVMPLGTSEWKKAADVGFVASAPTPPPAPTAPVAPPPPPADVPPSAPPVTAQVISTPAAPQMAVSVPSAATPAPVVLELPDQVQDDAAAANALALIVGGNTGSLSALADAVSGEGVNPFAQPYIRIKDGNWDTPKNAAANIQNFMPVGKRPWFGVYMTHRVAATGWKGKGSRGKSTPPVWSFVVPHLAVDKRGAELAHRVLHVGAKVQYTSGDARLKFDGIGQLRPNCHVLVWHPETGYFVIVIDNFQDTMDTLDGLKNVEKFLMKPMQFTIKQNPQVNKKKPLDDPSREWLTDQVFAEIVEAQETRTLMAAFEAYKAKAPQEVFNTVSAFMRGTDFQGLDAAARDKVLNDYLTQFGI